MNSIIYKLENNNLLIISKNVKVAIIKQEDNNLSNISIDSKDYVASLRELADAIELIDSNLE